MCHEWEFEFLQRKVLLVKNAIYITSITWKSLKVICISGENTILNLTENKKKNLACCFINWSWYRTGWKHVLIHLCYCKAVTKLGFSKLLFHSHGFKSALKITLAVSEICISTFVYFMEYVTKLYARTPNFQKISGTSQRAWTHWETEMKINPKLFEMSIFWVRKADMVTV